MKKVVGCPLQGRREHSVQVFYFVQTYSAKVTYYRQEEKAADMEGYVH